MNTKPVGGRGKKAPYSTSIVRVPDPLIGDVKLMIANYHKALELGMIEENDINNQYGYAINEAKKVLKMKKSARVSLEKLLQVLYDDPSIKL